MALNTEKYINVYYNKGDRKPYDVNGKPIAYLGQDFVGANEATIIRFNIGDDTGVVEGVADVKRADGEKAFLIMSKVTIGTDVFYELPLTDWHTSKVGKLVVAFKGFDGAITIVDGEIQANNLRIIVSDIFNIDIGYSPNSILEAPPFDPNDVSAIIASLSTKLNKADGINVVQALPVPNDGSLNGRYFLVKSGAEQQNAKLHVFDGDTAIDATLELDFDDLQDVDFASLANGNVLVYNSSLSKWVNSTRLTTAEANITNLQGRMTTEEGNVDTLQADLSQAEIDIANIEDGTTIVPKALGDQNGNTINTTYLTIATSNSTFVPLSSKGVANGVAPLGSDNKIPSIHLPGGVDDIKEFANLAAFPAVGEASIIFVALDTNIIYRWSGSSYVEISSSLALGTTASTAFAGDRGLATETKTNNIVSGVQGLTDTRITNSAVGTSPLIVNAIASTTEDLLKLQVNGSNFLRVDKDGYLRSDIIYSNTQALANGNVTIGSTGVVVRNNVNNTNPALVVRKQQGTGNILELQTGTSDKKFEIDVNGWIYQNGTRLFTQPVNTSNTFFGATSGTTTTTGSGGNSAFGELALSGLTTGNNNTAVGRTSFLSLSTGSLNAGLGVEAGRAITTGSNNTFIGVQSGQTGAWGTQIGTITNSTGIGYQSVTDKNNQMVFGNASVAEFKFDRNASATALLPITNISGNLVMSGTSGGVLTIYHQGQTALKTYTSNVVSAFGLITSYQSDAGSPFTKTTDILAMGDATVPSQMRFLTKADGSSTATERMRILANGNVGIGTGSPAQLLSVVSQSNTSGIQIRRSSFNANDYATLGFRVGTTDDSFNLAEIRGVRTNRAVSGDTSLSLHTFTNGALRESLLIRDDGLVGINETSPSAQLQVRSGATNRVPLIVDTLASQTANLQEWKVNNVLKARVDPDGEIASNGIYNTSGSLNAYVNATSTGTKISRNIADTNPALIVNLAHASATGNIQVWQKAGTAVAQIDTSGNARFAVVANIASSNNSALELTNNGAFIYRNIADSNPSLVVNQVSASSTGDILRLVKAGVIQASVAIDGIANFTGTPSNEQTANYTLVLTDKGKVLRINSSSNRTVTIPKNSAVAFPIDTEIAILRYGSGTVAIAPVDGDVTLQSADGERKIKNRYGSVALKKIAENEWVLVGSLEA